MQKLYFTVEVLGCIQYTILLVIFLQFVYNYTLKLFYEKKNRNE